MPFAGAVKFKKKLWFSVLTAPVSPVEFASRYRPWVVSWEMQAVELKRKFLLNVLDGCRGCCRMRGLG